MCSLLFNLLNYIIWINFFFFAKTNNYKTEPWLSFIPRTMMEEETNFWKLYSDLHICAIICFDSLPL